MALISGIRSAGAFVGAIVGAVAPFSPLIPVTPNLATFISSSITGAIATGAGEALGQLFSGVNVLSLNIDRVGTAALIGFSAGQFSALVQALGLGSRAAISVGGSVELLLSPAVARSASSSSTPCNRI